MKIQPILILAGLAAASAAATAQPAADPPSYQTPAHPAEPAAQLAEMLALYDGICLKAFPDDAAVAHGMAERSAPPLSAAQIRRYLHDDPGVGWRIAGRTATFDVTIEAPPYHACGIRTLTVAGFPDMAPYRALADRFEAGGHYAATEPLDRVVGGIHTVLNGEMRSTPRGGGEALIQAVSQPGPEAREPGREAIEIRFVHQIYTPPGSGAAQARAAHPETALPSNDAMGSGRSGLRR